jgi:hypothetical protein
VVTNRGAMGKVPRIIEIENFELIKKGYEVGVELLFNKSRVLRTKKG